MQGVEEPGGETLASVLPSEKHLLKGVWLFFFQHQPLLGFWRLHSQAHIWLLKITLEVPFQMTFRRSHTWQTFCIHGQPLLRKPPLLEGFA